MPAFMLCQICCPESTVEECIQFQRLYGCHACDRKECWHANPECSFSNRPREVHQDAELGDFVPHMRETRITCTADGRQMHGRLPVNWWSFYKHVRFVVNEMQQFTMGKASGHECNCLVDTLRQQLHLDCDIGAVREYVHSQDPNLVLGDYLELQHHWQYVLRGFAFVLDSDISPSNYKIVCVDATYIGNGDVEGDGAIVLYIARQNANHFVPLVSVNDDDVDEVESCRSSSCGNDDDVDESESCRSDASEAAEAAKALASLQSLQTAASSKKNSDNRSKVASSSSSAASQEEASEDGSASPAYDSDASDLFHLEVETEATWETPQDKDKRVAHLLAAQMRRHPLVPPQPNEENASTSFVAVQSGLKLPAAHCAFKGCSWSGLTKCSIEEHVVLAHGTQLLAAEEEVYGKGRHYGSSPLLSKIHYALNMHRSNQALRNFFMGYYRHAIAEIERCAVIISEQNHGQEMPHGMSACQGVPIVGPSVDRRTFGHLREVYNDNAICSMICFLCAQRRTHTLHPNSAIQRRYLELFDSQKSQRTEEEVLRIDMPQQYLSNLCRKTYLHRFARQGTPLWNAKVLGPMEPGPFVSKNIVMPKPTSREKPMSDDESSATSEEDCEEAWEWRRLYLTADGCFWDLICCPEDVVCSAECSHQNGSGVHERHIVCKHCVVPVCAECYDHICRAPLYASPMALANDNVIGYTYKTILKYKVSWIEAAAAQPAWTTMMCYYIEGDQGHLLEETMFESSFMTVVRGNVFSYHMPWEKIMQFMERTTSDEKLAMMPHDPEHLAHMVQLPCIS